MELGLLIVGCPEWEYLWLFVEQHPINEGIENPSLALNGTEGWQYMGTYLQGDRAIHGVRHRAHPKYNKVETISVSASSGFTLNQIVKTFKL